MRILRGRPTGWRVALATTLLPLAASVFAAGGDSEPGARQAGRQRSAGELPVALDPGALDPGALDPGALDPGALESVEEPEPAEELVAVLDPAPPPAPTAARTRGAGPAAGPAPVRPDADEPAAAALADQPVVLMVGRMRPIDAPWPIAGVSLTDPAVADVEVLTARLLTVTGRAPGTTDMLLWNEQGAMLALPVEVLLDTERLQADLSGLFPDSSVRIGQSRGVTVLSGTLARAEQAAQLRSFMAASGLEFVDTTRVAGVQQVQVQVRLAEVSRTGLRALGVNGYATGDDWFGGSAVGNSSGGALNPVNIGPGEGSPIDPLAFTFNDDVRLTPAVTLFGGSSEAGFQVFIQALQENQYLRVLAEPNLVALSGETASFLAGGEFPIPVVQGTSTGGGTALTIEYKEFGVGLRFKPVVLGDASIRLTVASEVSELSDIGAIEIQGFRVPSVSTRRAETTLEMKSGQTFAMAGLISEQAHAISSQVPGLGNLPILGALFRSVRYRNGETELLLLVSASLVEPTSDQVLPPLPGSTHVEPSDWELYARGRLESGPPARIAPDDQAWLAERGLDQLRGPGAWSVHGQAPARASTSRGRGTGGASPARRHDRSLEAPRSETVQPGEVN